MFAYDRKALLYGISAMSCSMLHCIFVSFYIDFFVRQNIMQKTDDGIKGDGGSSSSALSWFIVGQVVYAVWNALNDLGFGWLSDTSYITNKMQGGFNAVWHRISSLFGGGNGGKHHHHDHLKSKALLSRRRLSRVAIGGPLWAAAFAFLWFPTPFLRSISPALELSVKMIIYDGFFSYTTVSFRALLVDITTDGWQRELCNLYASIGHVIGSIGVMLASQLFEAAHHTSVDGTNGSPKKHSLIIIPTNANEATEDEAIPTLMLDHNTIQQNLSSFRMFCLFWAILAAIGFILSATAEGNKEVTLKEAKEKADDDNKVATSGGDSKGEMSFFSFVSQTIRRPGMITVLIVWFLQDYSCTFATNFFSLFLTLVAAPYFSPFSRSVMLLISFVVPHAITIIATPFIPTLGKKFIVSFYLGTRTAVGVAFLFLLASLNVSALLQQHVGGSSEVHPDAADAGSAAHNDAILAAAPMLTAAQAYTFAVLLLLNRVLTEAVCRTQGLVISDVCDEDTIAYNRPASMAGAIHGLVNVVSRPSQSVSPVLSCLYLASYGVLMPNSNGGGADNKEKGGASSNSNSVLNGAISTAIPICKLLAVTIIFTTIAMQFVWRMWYNLDGSYLSTIRMQMAMRVERGAACAGEDVGGNTASAATTTNNNFNSSGPVEDVNRSVAAHVINKPSGDSNVVARKPIATASQII